LDFYATFPAFETFLSRETWIYSVFYCGEYGEHWREVTCAGRQVIQVHFTLLANLGSGQGKLILFQESRERMAVSFLLAFCRLVLGFVFALSWTGKLRDVRRFRQTILRFRLLPPWLSGITTLLILGAELLVVVGTVMGTGLLLPTFLLAALLLLLFSGAIASVLVRRLHTSCTCFGMSDKPIAAGDLWRNSGFLCCALFGSAFLLWSHSEQSSLSMAVWLLVGGAAAVFVLIGLSVGDIMALFKSL
jgi:hypothetical protein